MTKPAAAGLLTPIAVVGLAVRYPGARDAKQLWENILGRRCEFRRMRDERLPLDAYYDPDPATPDRTYGRLAAYIDGFEFDWAAYRIPRSTYEVTDIAQWLALHVAAAALADFGYPERAIPKERTGVILGNTLTGEWSRAQTLRWRWPFVQRALREAAARHQLPPAGIEALARTMEGLYKSAFAEDAEDTLAGNLSNTIAGRICNHFDLHGGGYTVDGACSSSLLAVSTAATHLCRGELDLALAGGVDVSLDTFELIGFAKAGALTPDLMRVYDRRANGFLPGEGCGFVALRRLDDAVAAGDRIYAVLRGCGISTDGKGGIMAPSRDAQALAIRRAYEQAGYSPHSLAFIEGHGTGTAVGDRTELAAIAAALDSFAPAPPRACAMTSLKSVIGHTKAAAGIGAFVKAVLACNRRVIPPTAGCSEPNPLFATSAQSLYPAIHGEVLDPSVYLRAGVSAMGFGGINCHLTIESASYPQFGLLPSVDERALLVSAQDSEVFPLFAATKAELGERALSLSAVAERISFAELTDLAAELGRGCDKEKRLRAAVVAGSPDELAQRLRELSAQLSQSTEVKDAQANAAPRNVYVGWAERPLRVGFLFPGQGSQQLLMGRVLCERFLWARKIAVDAQRAITEAGGPDVLSAIFPPLERAADEAERESWAAALAETEVAQPAICLASLLHAQQLARLGVSPAVVGGHSLGELTACWAAGGYDADTLFTIAARRGQHMKAAGGTGGAMASLACAKEEATALIARVAGYATVANYNSPRQVTIAGEVAAIDAVVALATAAGIVARRLPVSSAFHSDLMRGAAIALAADAELPLRLRPLAVKLCSSIDGNELSDKTALRHHLSQQAVAPVDFPRLVEAMRRDCDILLEVGPGRVLSGLVADIAADPECPCLPVAAHPERAGDLNRTLALLWSRGVELNWPALYEQRLVRPFVADRSFLRNPCERPLRAPALADSGTEAAELGQLSPSLLAIGTSVPLVSERAAAPPAPAAPIPLEQQLIELVVQKTGYPRTSITLDARLLSDLNLDSIKAASLIASAAAAAGVAGRLTNPFRLANATLSELAHALRAAQAAHLPGALAAVATNVGTAAESRLDASSDPEVPWIRNFGIELVEAALPKAELGALPLFSQAGVLLLSEPSEADVVDALVAQLGGMTRVESAHFAAYAERAPKLGVNVIAVLPRRTPASEGPDTPAVDRLRSLLARLLTAARCAVAAPQPRSTLVFVQFGGLLDSEASAAALPLASAAAFARTLHLEHPELRVRVLDFAATMPAAALAELTLGELGCGGAFVAAAYELEQRRRVPRPVLQQPARYPRRPLSWSRSDVVLITGGGKGITAECALAIGRDTGACLAIVGSAPPPAQPPGPLDGELLANLARFASAGLTARYYSCELTDADAVTKLCARVAAELGPITAVVHGAGRNQPRPTATVSVEDALTEIGGKVLGALHLQAALAAAPPRLWLALTSIIGVTGLPRNGIYAFANEYLALVLRQIPKRFPGTFTQAIAFTIWEQLGMGAKLGIADMVQGLFGMTPLPVAAAVERFLGLFRGDPGTSEVVVTGRLPESGIWPGTPAAPPFGLRFVKEPTRLLPEVELWARTRLTLTDDPYLRDHEFRGSFLFPTVFGLEAMAQAAQLLRRQPISRIEQIRLLRPIPVDKEHGTLIELRLFALEDTQDGVARIQAAIRSEQTGFAHDHFSALLVLGERSIGPVAATAPPSPPLSPPLSIEPVDLYGGVLFQGPRFQRIQSVSALDSHRVVLQSTAAESEGDGKSTRALTTPRWVLGDPYLRDTLLQSVQLIVPQHVCLPVFIGSLTLHERPTRSPLTLTAVFHGTAGEEDVFDVMAKDETGRVVEHLRDYRLQILTTHPEHPRAEDLARPEGFDEAALRDRITEALAAASLHPPTLALRFVPDLAERLPKERHAQALALLTSVLGETVGRLAVACDDRYCLGAAAQGPEPLGCALVAIKATPVAESGTHLGSDSLRGELMRGGDLGEIADARLQAGRLSAQRLCGEAEIRLQLVRRQGPAVFFRAATPSGTCTVLTVAMLLARGPQRVAALAFPIDSVIA